MLFYSLVTVWMAIRIGQPGHYQQQSLRSDKLQLYTPQHGHYSQLAARPYQKTRQVLWLLEKGGKHNKARCSLEFNVLGQKTEYRYQRAGLVEGEKKKKGCPHNVENRSTGHTQQVIYSVVVFFVLFFCFLSEPRASSGHCECNREGEGWGGQLQQKSSSCLPCH